MPLTLRVADLKTSIANSGARWIADTTNLSNLTEAEKRRRLGATHPNGAAGLQQREVRSQQMQAAAAAAAATASVNPHAWDWRNVEGRNFVTPVRDQSSCGSCVAFGSIAAVEAVVRIEQNNPSLAVDLSEAQLFYCDASTQGCNCDTGWWPDKALGFLVTSGVGEEASFPYTPGNQPCHVDPNWQSRSAKVTGSHSITNSADMKTWLAARGALISCFTVYDDFFSYRSGVYHHVTGDVAGGHCICVVGYDDGAQCWICKNSWGPGWGDGGFFRIGYGQCGIDAEMWAVEGVAWNKVTLDETSRVTPAMAVNGANLVLAWTGTDQPSHLNVMTSTDAYHFSGKVILQETSFDGPGLAVGGGRVYLAWTGTDGPHHLNVTSSTDCWNFGHKVTLSDTAAFGPALAYMKGRVFLAWVGTDAGRHINVMSSTDGVAWSNKVTLDETSDSQVALGVYRDSLLLAWQGTDSGSHLNLRQSADGHTWTNRLTLGDSSDHTPALVQGDELVIGWTGRDSNHSLNRMVSSTGPEGFGGKITFSDSATSGVALVNFAGKVRIAWGGTDSGHRLNVMSIPVP